jgi:hypothetical protein
MIHKENVFRFLMMTTLCVWLALTVLGVSGQLNSLVVFEIGVGWFVFVSAIFGYVSETFMNPFSRRLYSIATALGILTSAFASFYFADVLLKLIAVLMVFPWMFVLGLYVKEHEKYEQTGRGLMIKGAYVDPPVSEWKSGMVLASEGTGSNGDLSLCHGELIIQNPSTGALETIADYMEKGPHFYTADVVYDRFVNKNNERFYLLEPVVPWTEEQHRLAWDEAKAMWRDNRKLRCVKNKPLKAMIETKFAHLTADEQHEMRKKKYYTGYYWKGLWCGAESKEPEWTCISFVLVLLHRIGVKTCRHAIGLFGLGTGILDPIIPVNFATDRKHFRIVMRPDYQPEPLRRYSLLETIRLGVTGWPLMVADITKFVKAVCEQFSGAPPIPPVIEDDEAGLDEHVA